MIFFKKYQLFFLILLAILVRIILIWPNNIVFNFDQGKDSLAILDLIKNFHPKLIGPWTSIPGLYFGAGWYYLLAPVFFLTNGNPMSGVLIMILLNALSVYLTYKYISKFSAILIAFAPVFLTYSLSAWNPFPMSFLLILIFIFLQKKEFLNNYNLFFLGFCLSLGFHFSSAYAFFLTIGIFLLLLKRKIINKLKLKLKHFLILGFGFILPFLPQLIFEFRHNWIETKAIVNYFFNSQTIEEKNLFLINVKTALKELSLSFLPRVNYPAFDRLFLILAFLILALSFILFIRKKRKLKYFWELLFLVVLPIFGITSLHFNIWYLVGMMPIVAFFIGQFFEKQPSFLKFFYLFLIFMSIILKINFYFENDRNHLQTVKSFLPVKLKTIDKIRELSDGESFSSYHYVSEIYDYSYQYLYFWQAFQGEDLPVEFSYAPGEISYVKEKPRLLKKLNYKEKNKKPKYVFYIVEKPSNQEFLDQWWGRQKYNQIIKEIKISEHVKLYMAES